MNITTESVLAHQLVGYSFVEPIYQGPRTTVYRAVETATQQSVVIKVLAHEHPSFAELVQFRNQYTVAKNLPISGIVRPLSLESWAMAMPWSWKTLGVLTWSNMSSNRPSV